MKKIVTAVMMMVFSAVMAGCGSAPVRYEVTKFWKQDKVTYEQAKKDYYDCRDKAKTAAERETQIGGLTESCMKLAGYKWGEYKKRIR